MVPISNQKFNHTQRHEDVGGVDVKLHAFLISVAVRFARRGK
jgi:hypothetical protein